MRYEPEPNTGCWLFAGYVGKNGYGHVHRRPRGVLEAHRVSYEEHVGPIPDGMVVMHSCSQRSCVNPAHLSVGTQRQNIRDAVEKGTVPGRWRERN